MGLLRFLYTVMAVLSLIFSMLIKANILENERSSMNESHLTPDFIATHERGDAVSLQPPLEITSTRHVGPEYQPGVASPQQFLTGRALFTTGWAEVELY